MASLTSYWRSLAPTVWTFGFQLLVEHTAGWRFSLPQHATACHSIFFGWNWTWQCTVKPENQLLVSRSSGIRSPNNVQSCSWPSALDPLWKKRRETPYLFPRHWKTQMASQWQENHFCSFLQLFIMSSFFRKELRDIDKCYFINILAGYYCNMYILLYIYIYIYINVKSCKSFREILFSRPGGTGHCSHHRAFGAPRRLWSSLIHIFFIGRSDKS